MKKLNCKCELCGIPFQAWNIKLDLRRKDIFEKSKPKIKLTPEEKRFQEAEKKRRRR